MEIMFSLGLVNAFSLYIKHRHEDIDSELAFNSIITDSIIRLQPSYLLSYLNDEHY